LRLRKQDDEREKREEDREKRVEKRLSLLGLLFAVPALILGLLGVNIRGFTSGQDGLPLAAVMGWFIAGFALAGLAYWFLTKFRDKEAD
jgi:Mg2+ and Co2+ transporter CorA